jgi:hypothetical protein
LEASSKNNDLKVVLRLCNLLFVTSKGELGSQQYRWAMVFNNYRPMLFYEASKENVVTDALFKIYTSGIFGTEIIEERKKESTR